MIGFALTDIKTCVNDWVIDIRKKKEIDITHERAEQATYSSMNTWPMKETVFHITEEKYGIFS